MENKEQEDSMGRKSLEDSIFGSKDGKTNNSPLNAFLSRVLDHLAVAYPHSTGDKSENENRFIAVKRQITNEYYKLLIPDMKLCFDKYHIIKKNNTRVNIGFKNPTVASR